MSSIIKDLRRLVSKGGSPKSGVVVSVGSGTVQVKTESGIVSAVYTGVLQYREADVVRIVDGVVVGKIKRVSELPEYHV